MVETLKVYSVVINWNDSYPDMGDFGDAVRARDDQHAQRIVRARMAWAHWAEHRDEGESRRESLSLYDNGDGTFFGSVVECYEGAIWKAKELEAALRLAHRALVAAYGEPGPERAALESELGRDAILAARKIINEIDAL